MAQSWNLKLQRGVSDKVVYTQCPLGAGGRAAESEYTHQAAACEEVQGPPPHPAGYRLPPVQQARTLQWVCSPKLYLH